MKIALVENWRKAWSKAWRWFSVNATITLLVLRVIGRLVKQDKEFENDK